MSSNYEYVNSIPIITNKMATFPKFTIAIPTFEREKLLKQAIDSVLAQKTTSTFELLVVDNQPQRNCPTEALMSNYSDNRIKYYKNEENLGMIGNWNRLYHLAQGEYVIMLHDDDLLYSDFLDFLDKIIKKYNNEFDIIFTPHTTAQTNQPKPFPPRRIYKYSYLQKIRKSDFLWGNIVGPPVGMCIKRKVFLKTSGFNSRNYPSIDYDFYSENSNIFKSVIFGGYPISVYRIGINESMESKTLIKFVINDLEIKQRIISSRSNHLSCVIWKYYWEFQAYGYLKKMKKLLNNNDLEIYVTLKNMGYRFRPYLFIPHLFLNYYKKFNFLFRRNYFRI